VNSEPLTTNNTICSIFLKRFGLSAWFCAVCFFAFSQTPIATLNWEVKFMRSTSMGESYLILKDNTILKIDDQGKELARFKQPFLGNIQSFDLSNPFKPMAYYVDFQTIVFFDKQLNVVNQLDLKTIGLSSITAVCSYLDNQLIIAEESSNKLKRINYSGKILAETTIFSEDKKSKNINLLLSKSGYVYVLTNYSQMLYFDTSLELDAMLSSSKDNSQLKDVFLNAGFLYTFDAENAYICKDNDFSQEILNLPFKLGSNEQVHISNTRFFWVKAQEVIVFERK
jgi:hypothetical protein